MASPHRTVPAENFVATLAANVDNERLSDEAFRAFVRNSLPIVIGAETGVRPASAQFEDAARAQR